MPPKKSSKEALKLAEDVDASKLNEQSKGAEQNGNDDAPELSDALLDAKIKYLEERLGKASAKEKEFANKLAEELRAAGKDERELKVKLWSLKALEAELKTSEVSKLTFLPMPVESEAGCICIGPKLRSPESGKAVLLDSVEVLSSTSWSQISTKAFFLRCCTFH